MRWFSTPMQVVGVLSSVFAVRKTETPRMVSGTLGEGCYFVVRQKVMRCPDAPLPELSELRSQSVGADNDAFDFYECLGRFFNFSPR